MSSHGELFCEILHLISRTRLGTVFLLSALAMGLASARPAAGGDEAPTLLVSPEGLARIAGQSFRCSLGSGGVRRDKREGDGATPAGEFPLRQAFYRPDRLAAPPATGLPRRPLRPDDGWCDDPASSSYNQPVKLPFPASHERLWREDGLYDLVVVVGYNDDPPARAGAAQSSCMWPAPATAPPLAAWALPGPTCWPSCVC